MIETYLLNLIPIIMSEGEEFYQVIVSSGSNQG